ncbi:Protein unc-50 [Trichuris trichiura]|uniref:Protein unc-50 n=1 Tax=Trichuris trichiura TaxID=36087 RepID=A0A077Z6C4_TRITR|nr:Protein unc-50 [Trichuris trichiura]
MILLNSGYTMFRYPPHEQLSYERSTESVKFDCTVGPDYPYSSPPLSPGSRSTRSSGCFQHVQLTALAKCSRYFRRLIDYRQMDFEFALWQMLYLMVAPRKVYRNFMYRKRTKDQWARDDPAFLVALSAALFLSSVLYAFSLWLSAFGFFKFLMWVVFIDCIGTGMVIATMMWALSNGFLRRTNDQDVEWGYCFDVHLNAFFPVLVFLHVILPIVYPVLNGIPLLSCLVGNALWFIAVSYYIYITFLGYAALSFLKNVHVFLYPFTFIFIGFFASLTVRWSVSEAVFNFYRYRVGD